MCRARIELARCGGKARALALTAERRSAIARRAGRVGGRGRRKDDLLPEDLRERIWAELDKEAATTLWHVNDEAHRPLTRTMARLSLRDLAKNGTVRAYKVAHELMACL